MTANADRGVRGYLAVPYVLHPPFLIAVTQLLAA
jgi:hypothetical protein